MPLNHAPPPPENPPPIPEEVSQYYEKPLQRALCDFDIVSSDLQVIGADPIDLSEIPMEAVKSVIAPWAVITIMAHAGEGQAVADLLASRPDLTRHIVAYGQDYFAQNIMDFAMNALTDQQMRNVQAHRNRQRTAE